MYPIVKVEWVDAESEAGWHTPEEVEKMQGAPCVTIGFLVRKPTRKSPIYVVAHTVGADHEGDVNGVIKIPKAWVKSVEEQNARDRKET